MEIIQEQQAELNILALKGRLDASTSDSLEIRLKEGIDKEQLKLLLDFRELEYISSAGLRVLLTYAKKYKHHGGVIGLATLNSNVKQVFEISGFTSIFPIYENREEAVEEM